MYKSMYINPYKYFICTYLWNTIFQDNITTYLSTREKEILYIYIILHRRFNKYFITVNKIISAFIRI